MAKVESTVPGHVRVSTPQELDASEAVRELVSRHQAQDVEGGPLDCTGYLRLRRKGSQYGGFVNAFVSTGVINIRLQHSDEIPEPAL